MDKASENGWIDVDDRYPYLPDKLIYDMLDDKRHHETATNQPIRVLALCSDGWVGEVAYIATPGEFRSGRQHMWMRNLLIGRRVYGVRYWRPLPEPPEVFVR